MSEASPVLEPRTGKPVGVWFEGAECLRYRGTLPVVIQFGKRSPEHVTEPMIISRCPPCEGSRLMAQYGTNIKRWIILPP